MKKLLAILGAVGLTATSSSAVVSCAGDAPTTKVDDLVMDITNDGKVAVYTIKQKIKIFNDFDVTSEDAQDSFGFYTKDETDTNIGTRYGEYGIQISDVQITNKKDKNKLNKPYGLNDKKDKEVTVEATYKVSINIDSKSYVPKFTFCLYFSYSNFANLNSQGNRHKDTIDGEDSITHRESDFTPIAGNVTIKIPGGPVPVSLMKVVN